MMNSRRFSGCVFLCWLLAGGPFVVCAPIAPSSPPPVRKEVEAALARSMGDAPSGQKLRILLLADKKDHGAEAHDYPLWQERWALLLGGKAASSSNQVNLF